MTILEMIKPKMVELGIKDNFELSKISGIPVDDIEKIGNQSAHIMELFNKTSALLKALSIPLPNGDLLPKHILQPTELPELGGVISKIQPVKLPEIDNIISDENEISIPVFDIRASAGSGAYNELENNEFLNFQKLLRRYFGLTSFTNLSLITSNGDSMFPTIPENCYLLVQQCDVKEGEICIARVDDELYVKRLKKHPRLKLLSDNKAYEAIELDGTNFEIIGRVVGYFKKISTQE